MAFNRIDILQHILTILDIWKKGKGYFDWSWYQFGKKYTKCYRQGLPISGGHRPNIYLTTMSPHYFYQKPHYHWGWYSLQMYWIVMG